MRYSDRKAVLYYFQMKIFKNRNRKKIIKDEYQRMVEKFGSEQLKLLADKGLRLQVTAR